MVVMDRAPLAKSLENVNRLNIGSAQNVKKCKQNVQNMSNQCKTLGFTCSGHVLRFSYILDRNGAAGLQGQLGGFGFIWAKLWGQ